MLTKVVLTNFQAHKKLEIDCAGFTTLTGGSNGGKSAVLRAIQGLVRNDSAAEYVRHGQKSLSVLLCFDDGFSVEWIKGGGENKYILTDGDGNSRIFDKVGSDVPDEVREVLRLGPIAIKNSDKEYVNFHSQLEAPFLLGTTPGNVAKLFGELTSASSLYSAINEGNRQSRSLNSLKSTRKTDLEAAQQSLAAFVGLDEDLERLDLGRSLCREANQLSQQIKNISAHYTTITTLNEQIVKLESEIGQLSALSSISLDGLESSFGRKEGINSIVTKLHNLSRYEQGARALVESLSSIQSLDLDGLEAVSMQINSVQEATQAISVADANIDQLSRAVQDAQSDLNGLDNKIGSLTELLTACPSCGETLNEQSKAILVNGRSEHAAC